MMLVMTSVGRNEGDEWREDKEWFPKMTKLTFRWARNQILINRPAKGQVTQRSEERMMGNEKGLIQAG